jgi:hypothetical protein
MTTKKAYEKFAKRFENGNVATRLVFTDTDDVKAYVYCRTEKGRLAVVTVIDKNGESMPGKFEITFFDTNESFDKHHGEHWTRSEALTLNSDEPISFEYVSEKRHNGLVYPLQPTARKLIWQGFLLGLVSAGIVHASREEQEVLNTIRESLEAGALASAWQKEKYGFDD